MIVVYTQPGCIYCSKVKLELEINEIRYTEIDVDQNPKQWEKLKMMSPNIKNLPQIFFNYTHIGVSTFPFLPHFFLFIIIVGCKRIF